MAPTITAEVDQLILIAHDVESRSNTEMQVQQVLRLSAFIDTLATWQQEALRDLLQGRLREDYPMR